MTNHQPDPGVVKSIQDAYQILCVSHISPDGDAIGSLTAMGQILHYLEKKVTLALQDDVPPELMNLPYAHSVIGADDVGDTYDLIICLDSSSSDRMGRVYRPSHHRHIPVAVIDHHITNTKFGTVNWVEPECAATCQMLVYLTDMLQIPLEEPLARSLLTGLVTDTHCFRTPNTTPDVLAVATRLVNEGADLAKITDQTLNRRPYNVLQLWSQVLPTMQLEDGVIWTVVHQDNLDQIGNPNADSQLSSVLITADEADISAVFTERIGDDGYARVECSFRAKPGYDVGSVAFRLGGGGHPPASGCTIDGNIHEIVPKVVAELQQARKQKKQQV
ncbi:MAG: bifunctional oligoribonuclease/PAP phosphatase NrnA [Chloroflexota bacterium]